MSMPHARRRRAAMIVAPTVAAALALAFAPVAAASADEPDGDLSRWVDVDTGEVHYYDAELDLFEVVEAETGVPNIAIPTEEYEGGGVSLFADTTYTLAVVYDGSGMSGTSTAYITANSGICAGTNTYGFASLGSWNDRISSFSGFNGCNVTLYWDIDFGDPHFGAFASASLLGDFDNQASSIRMS